MHEVNNSASPAYPGPAAQADTLCSARTESPGEHIGNYRLMELIGEGGFGSVYLAEQEKPVTRRVALKIIKLGMDTKQVIARFEAERQALAIMDHPHIARVLDAGATEAGRPYFVMELVRGVPITEFSDRRQLTVRDRLELLLPVRQAVQHAHQKGIIHRDLKPSNIMVALEADQPVPKVIDFGIAKAMHARLTDKTVYTEYRQFVGTPEYMAPEQAEQSGMDVDTRADIYSLGVILYELLTGTTPFDSQSLRNVPLDQVYRILRESPPQKPSARLGALTKSHAAVTGSSNVDLLAAPPRAAPPPDSSGHRPLSAITDIAKQRRSDPVALRRALRGELDWIVLKCLEKDRTRRYASASELAADIRRYLHSEPVLACPPSASYRFQKFYSRHRGGFAAAGAVLLALIAGLALAMYGLVQAKNQQAIAVANEVMAKREAAKARTEAAKAQQIARFLQNMLSAVDPAFARGKDTTVMREMLDLASRRVGAALAQQPEVEAAIRETIGSTYQHLSIYDKAQAQADAALDATRRALGDEHPETLRQRGQQANVLRLQSRFREAETLYDKLLVDIRRIYGEQHLLAADALDGLAGVYLDTSRIPEALKCFDQSLAIRRKLLPPDSPEFDRSMTTLSNIYRQLGRRDEALQCAESAYRIRLAQFGEDHPATLRAMGVLAGIEEELGHFEKTESLWKRCLELRERVYGEENQQTIEAMGQLANFYMDRSRLKEAEPLLIRRAALCRKVFGPKHEMTLMSIGDQADLFRLEKKYADAEPLFREAIDRWSAAQGPNHPNVLITQQNLVTMLITQGRAADADHESAELVDHVRKSPLSKHWYVGRMLMLRGQALILAGKYPEAEKALQEGDQILSKTFETDHPPRVDVANTFVQLYTVWKKPAEAEKWKARLPKPATNAATQ